MSWVRHCANFPPEIRASNTAPIISVRAEGATLSEARAMLELVKERLDKYNLDLSALDNVPLYVS